MYTNKIFIVSCKTFLFIYCVFCFVFFVYDENAGNRRNEGRGKNELEKRLFSIKYTIRSLLFVYNWKKKKRCMIFGYTSVKFNITLYLLLLLLLLLCIIFTAAKYVYRYTNIKRSIATDSRFSFLQPISCTRRNWIRYAVFFVRTTSADDRTREKADSPNTWTTSAAWKRNSSVWCADKSTHKNRRWNRTWKKFIKSTDRTRITAIVIYLYNDVKNNNNNKTKMDNYCEIALKIYT